MNRAEFGRRRCRAALIAASWGVVATLAGCGADGAEVADVATTSSEPSTTISAPAVSSTTSPPTTSPPATSSTVASTTVATTVPVTAPSEFPYWSTPCTERRGDPAASYDFAEALGTFTTLGAAPILDIETPGVITSQGPYGSITIGEVIPGGVLVGVYPPNGWPTADEILTTSSLTAVDDDGTVRWRRCFDVETSSFVVAPAELEPSVVWVMTSSRNRPLEILGVDLVTGDDVPFPLDVSPYSVRGIGERFVVLGARFDAPPISPDDRMIVVDTLNGGWWEIGYPPGWNVREGSWLTLHDPNPLDDDVVLVDGSLYPGQVEAVNVGDGWTDDPSVLQDALPPMVASGFGVEPFELQLLDGAGGMVWTVPDFHEVGREGFHWLIAGDVLLADRCTTWDRDGYCGWTEDGPPEEELVAFDIEIGRELWTLPGGRDVPVAADGVAIVTQPTWEDGSWNDGYVLIDLRSGEVIGPADGTWPSGAFRTGCCGEYDYVHTARTGGVVIAVDGTHVRVWYPPALTSSTVTVDLAG